MSRRLAWFALALIGLLALLLWLLQEDGAAAWDLESSPLEAESASGPVEEVGGVQSSTIERLVAPETRLISSEQPWGGVRSEPGVRVRVFAHDGSPAENVPVAVLAVRKYGKDQIGWTHFTDSDGRVVLEVSCPSQDERADRYRIRAAIPLSQPCETVLTWENYADEHVLTLPPTGQVQVELRNEGQQAFYGWAEVGIRVHSSEGDPPEGMGAFDFSWVPDLGAVVIAAENGLASLSWVGLGLELDVGMETEPSEDLRLQTGAGPSREGETVIFRFYDLPILTLLEIPVLDPSGAPLANERVSASSSPFAISGWGGSTTNAEGVLTLVANPDLRESRTSYLFARAFTAPVPWGAVWKEPVCAAGTRTRLPAVRLGEVPVMGKGVVVRADGSREPEAEVNLLWQGQDNRFYDFGPPLRLDRAAEFILYGFTLSDPHRLDANSGWRRGSTELRAGALDHRIVLDGDEVRPAWIEFDDPQFMNLAEVRIGGSPFKVEKDATFLHWGYEDDPATLQVTDRFTAEVLAAVEGVIPVANYNNRDPRLRPLDLRGKIRKVRVVWDRSQAEVPDWSIALDPPHDERHDFNELEDRAVEFLTARTSLNLWINAAGYRPRLYQDVGENLEVSLQRAIPVSLRLAQREMAEVAPWIACHFMLQPDSPGTDDSNLCFRFDATGSASAWIPSPGKYFIYLELADALGPHRTNNTAWLEGEVRTIIEASHQEIVISTTLVEAVDAWRELEEQE